MAALQASSPVFAAMFKVGSNFKEALALEVEISDATFEQVEALARLCSLTAFKCVRVPVEIDSENVALIKDALDLAKKYQANGVRSFCCPLNRAKPTWEGMRAFEQTSDGEALGWSDEELKFLINHIMPRGFDYGKVRVAAAYCPARTSGRSQKLRTSTSYQTFRLRH